MTSTTQDALGVLRSTVTVITDAPECLAALVKYLGDDVIDADLNQIGRPFLDAEVELHGNRRAGQRRSAAETTLGEIAG